jgi:hypothetical protein
LSGQEIRYTITVNEVQKILCKKCRKRLKELIAKKVAEQLVNQMPE